MGAIERGEYAPAPAQPSERLREQLTDPSTTRWAGSLDGVVVGSAEVRPAGEPKTAFARIYVLPDMRGNGVGRSLLTEVVRDQQAAGMEILATTVLADTPGARFALDLGAAIGDELVINVLDFETLDRAALRRVVDTDHIGYRLVHWSGRTPDALVDSYALAKRAIADAPNNHLPTGAVVKWDRGLVRQSERERADRGAELWVTAAVVGSSTVAAFTAVEVGRSAVDVGQEDTVVVGEHRRLGLATWVKAAMALRLADERPSVRRLSSTTAIANTGMRTVNARTGFRELTRRLLITANIADLAKRLHPPLGAA
ncbi:GNAT family N-acetyltransferase [Kribbella solani]|uniref:GNAT superfamily N-acetyltransferase n=1 Tax=Kribbella solani TaxID=236067 RepID=A0A841DWG6_9ACTN|nr:GNAT superfamily N-acetyltransferase [Kribbella solani]